MRPAIHGNEVVFDKDTFIGINLGFNFYAEHEGNIKKLAESFNYMYSGISLRELAAYKKSLHAINKKWKNTSILPYILNPYTTALVKRTITIDNSSKAPYYNKYLCFDEEYVALYFYNKSYPQGFSEKLTSKQKFREDELYCMRDFASQIPEKPFMNNVLAVGRDIQIVGVWTSFTPYMLVLVKKNLPHSEEIVAGIQKAFRNYDLALAPEMAGVFEGRGLILYDAENLFNYEKRVTQCLIK